VVDIDNKGINQLLLSPLFLWDQILGTIMPGTVLILLLAFKGNATIRGVWYNSPFGYKTKIAAFVLLSYVVGSVVKLPVYLLVPLRKKKQDKDAAKMPAWLKEQTPEIQKMILGAASEGVLLATPGLFDRLVLVKADAAFHLGTGMALLIAALIPGDGSLRWLEALAGLVMIRVAIWKGKEFEDRVLHHTGIGYANVFARMTPQQFVTAAAIMKSLKLPMPEVTAEKPAEVISPESATNPANPAGGLPKSA
jgi:hypothetical protein